MFSFFKSHKKSPIASPTNERTDNNVQKSGDDFVLISNNPNNIYPAVTPNAAPTQPPIPSHHPFNRQFSVTINYTASVPFKLNPAILSDNTDNDIWSFKLREMNSVVQRINMNEYDFKLERSIVES